jgi:hypothetical protein
MSYSTHTFVNNHIDGKAGPTGRVLLQAFDTGLVNSGAGYAQQFFLNDANNTLPIEALSELNRASYYLANSGTHYTNAPTWSGEKFHGIPPELRATLKLMTDQVAVLRP